MKSWFSVSAGLGLDKKFSFANQELGRQTKTKRYSHHGARKELQTQVLIFGGGDFQDSTGHRGTNKNAKAADEKGKSQAGANNGKIRGNAGDTGGRDGDKGAGAKTIDDAKGQKPRLRGDAGPGENENGTTGSAPQDNVVGSNFICQEIGDDTAKR